MSYALYFYITFLWLCLLFDFLLYITLSRTQVSRCLRAAERVHRAPRLQHAEEGHPAVGTAIGRQRHGRLPAPRAAPHRGGGRRAPARAGCAADDSHRVRHEYGGERAASTAERCGGGVGDAITYRQCLGDCCRGTVCVCLCVSVCIRRAGRCCRPAQGGRQGLRERPGALRHRRESGRREEV